MFVFDFKQENPQPQAPKSTTDLAMKYFAKQGTVKMFPKDKNQIYIRIEHLADRMDRRNDIKASTQTIYFNLLKYAKDLFLDVNKVLPTLVNIEEVTLSGSQLITEMKKNRPNWKGIGDATELAKLPNNKP